MEVLNRLKEPSSWAALSILAGLFGVHIAPEAMQSGVQIASGVAGLAAFFLPESK